MYYYLRVIWAMYFTEPRVVTVAGAGGAAIPSDDAGAREPEPALASASAAGTPQGAVATLERVAQTRRTNARRTVTSRQAVQAAQTAPQPLTLGTTIALTLAVVLTLALGIIPGPIVTLAEQAARLLLP